MKKYSKIFQKKFDEAYKEERGFARWVIFTTIAFLLFITVIQQDNIFRLAEAISTAHSQKGRVEKLEKEIREMDEFLRKVHSDPAELERYARETFYFCEPGEDVYIDKR